MSTDVSLHETRTPSMIVGHDGDHEAYYGWTGRAEVWS